MKKKYIKPETEIIVIETSKHLTGGSGEYKEDGTVNTQAGEGKDDEGEWINLGKYSCWDEEDE
ncbi:MAG: hypothetical protein SPM31_08945 [Prevotella sp.]|nr:hypothetical protein [Prevotella sp.]